MVEDEGFRQMIHVLNPGYTLVPAEPFFHTPILPHGLLLKSHLAKHVKHFRFQPNHLPFLNGRLFVFVWKGLLCEMCHNLYILCFCLTVNSQLQTEVQFIPFYICFLNKILERIEMSFLSFYPINNQTNNRQINRLSNQLLVAALALIIHSPANDYQGVFLS